MSAFKGGGKRRRGLLNPLRLLLSRRGGGREAAEERITLEERIRRRIKSETRQLQFISFLQSIKSDAELKPIYGEGEQPDVLARQAHALIATFGLGALGGHKKARITPEAAAAYAAYQQLIAIDKALFGEDRLNKLDRIVFSTMDFIMTCRSITPDDKKIDVYTPTPEELALLMGISDQVKHRYTVRR